MVPLVPGTPPELVVYRELSACPYLPGRAAQLPLRLPTRRLRRHELDQRLAAGDRRQGFVLYRPTCPDCRACEPIRIDVSSHVLSRNLRRVLRRGDAALTTVVGRPLADARRVQLYNEHQAQRGLGEGHPPIDLQGYRGFLVSSCCETLEMRYLVGRRLVGVAVVDRGLASVSAVYCCYEAGYDSLGIGTYSIIKQVELARRLGVRYLYLGLYVAECRAMRYKARFRPHERLRDGTWQRHE